MISYYLSCDSWGDGKSVCLWRTEDNKSIKVARFQDDTIAKKFSFIKKQKDNQWWCSEVVAYLLGFSDFRKHPNELAKIYGAKKIRKG